VRTDLVLRKFLSGMPVRFEMAEGAAEYAAVIVDIDDVQRRRTTIERVLIRDEQPQT
jgi:ser/thr protein phosphatase